MQQYSFNQNNRPKYFHWISFITGVLVILIGLVCYYCAKTEYFKWEPLIDLEVSQYGLLALYTAKFLFAYILIFLFGIVHILIVVKVMDFIKQNFL